MVGKMKQIKVISIATLWSEDRGVYWLKQPLAGGYRNTMDYLMFNPLFDAII